MEIDRTIKRLRGQMGISQERLAREMGVAVQTGSRWENEVNYPDLSMLPFLAAYFRVTTDYLLGVKGETNMAKLLKTVETFEVPGKEEAQKMVDDFKAATFPKLLSYHIQDEGETITLEVTKEFGVELSDMGFEQ